MTATPQNFDAMITQWRKEREDEMAKIRAELITKLDALGVTAVTARYEAYGDSGNVEEVCATPDHIKLDHDLEHQIGNFAWGVAYDQHPGFENNEGGYGVLSCPALFASCHRHRICNARRDCGQSSSRPIAISNANLITRCDHPANRLPTSSPPEPYKR